VWRLCDGATSAAAIAAALHEEMGIPEAEAVVDLTLKQLARLRLLELPLELPVESRGDQTAPSRRWLLGRGLTAAMLPAVYTILAPSPLEAQSPGGVPTLASVSPGQGTQGTTVAVTLTGTNFIVGATTVIVGGNGVTVTNVVVSGATLLTANFVLDSAAAVGARSVTITTAAGTSAGQTFTITLPLPQPVPPTLTGVSPNQGIQGTTVAVTLTGTNFVVGATTVNIGGGGVTVTNVVVSAAASLTANFVLDPAAAVGARTVTVTTAAGTSGGQTFTINVAGPPPAPTLTSVSPNRGVRGRTVALTLTGTNFVVGGTTVGVSGTGVTVTQVTVVGGTSLTTSFVLDPSAVAGPVSVRVTTAAGTSGAQTFLIIPPLPAPTLTSISPAQGVRGTTVVVTLTGTAFVPGATTVNVSGGGVTANVVTESATSLTASFVLDPAAAPGARTVTVTTPGGTSTGQTFTISVPPGSATFTFTGTPDTFTVPAGVVSVTIQASGAAGGKGSGADLDPRSKGGRITATVSVVPGALLTVRVGGSGPDGESPSTAGGFNGGGGSSANGGGGGGASSVHDGSTPLVIAGGGGGGGGSADLLGGLGGAGGGLTAQAGGSVVLGGGGGGGGTQAAGGGGGTKGNSGGTDGTPGTSGTGGIGSIVQAGQTSRGGGGGGGGHFGGGGGGGGGGGIGDIDGGGGGGGSSFAAPGATGVVHQQGVNSGDGSVTISW
jgi:hypothetical protein